MKITREETSPREVSLAIELESADIEPFLDRSYRRVVNKTQIPGFRPGKAPRILVENYVGREALVRESADAIVQDALDKAIKTENLDVFGDPEVELTEIDPFSVKAVVPLEPIVELGDFRSIRLQPEPVEVTGERLEAFMERLRYDAAPWEPADRPLKFGDLATLDVEGFIEGERVANDRGIDFIPSQDNPIPFPGFSVYLEGMKRDESKEFTLVVPEDYADTSIAGKECRFSVTALEIKEKALPDLDDEFAKGVGEGYESLEALRSKVHEDLTEQATRASQREFQNRSLEEVVKGVSVQVSDLTMNREIDHLLEEQLQSQQDRRMDMESYLRNVGKTREELRDELRPAAVERLTRFLVVRKLAQEEGIEVSPEEVGSEVDKLASASSDSADSLRMALSSDRARSSISSGILARKVLERLAQIVGGDAEGEGTGESGPAATADRDADGEEAEGDSPQPSREDADASQDGDEGGSPSDN